MSKAVSAAISELLDHLSGIPRGREPEAEEIQNRGKKPSDPVQPLGTWYNGCYYTKIKNNKNPRGYSWKLQYCMA